jgi:crotonobetainyl-CoA:carnitine CoA-transferase CaiB-like acyl-CoA transferase
MTSILDGIKVLDFTQAYAGPFCTLLLKDFGADIIKVERPGAGDLTRNDVPYTDGMEGGPYINLNRGEKSITLNLKEKKGIDICVWSDWST